MNVVTARITPDMLTHLKNRGQKANIPLLKQAVQRLCLAATQKSTGQRKGDNSDNSVNWQSPEIDMLHFIILSEAVALVLSGRLDNLPEKTKGVASDENESGRRHGGKKLQAC